MKAILSLCIGLALSGMTIAQAQTVTTPGGTANKLPKFTSSTAIGDSAITESGGNVGIGTTSPAAGLDVYGGLAFNSMFHSVVLGPFSYTSVGPAIDLGHFRSGSIVDVDVYASGNCADSASHYRLAGLGWKTNGNVVLTQADVADICGQQQIAFYHYTNEQSDPNYFFLYAQVANPANSDPKTIYVKLSSNAPFDGSSANHSGFASVSTGLFVDALQNGKIGIGTTTPSAKLEVNGNVKLSAAGSSITFGDGTVQNTAWSGSLCGGDYAEAVAPLGERNRYGSGDVLVINEGDEGEVALSSAPYSRLVAGIYSTKPGVVGRRQADPERSSTQIPMAMVGIVPTKVTAENGAIRKGDLLVTSSIAGHAMKGTDPQRMLGAVLGKALGNLSAGTGVIEVLVSLQ